jgi:hypothetical protein
MKYRPGRKASGEWVVHQLRGLPQPSPGVLKERRERLDRRVRMWWSIAYGSFNPRRRQPARRNDDGSFHALDWHSSHLMAVAIGILLMCFADAFMTLVLLSNGAQEVNPFMASFVYRSVTVFTALKMAMTGISVVLMVFLARYRFMRVIRVEIALYAVLMGYTTLIGYELWMVSKIGDPYL